MTETSSAATKAAGPVGRRTWLSAGVKTARPRQWPKNLLVFAAPMAGASLGRAHGLGYAMAAFGAFVAASSSMYLLNDVIDANDDKAHPVKRHRPIASGQLSKYQALLMSVACVVLAEGAGLWLAAPGLCLVVGIYLMLSLLYSIALKRVPYVEMLLVASGFTLRALGGAVATRVPPSGWFLVVCSLGALLVAASKRGCELRLLGAHAVRHRPVLRTYSAGALRLAQQTIAIVMLIAYVGWALGGPTAWTRAWHLASVLPLAAALVRFDRLTARPTARPVEDLISRDVIMLGCEAVWLALFLAGL